MTHSHRKRFGQHFLHDTTILSQMADCIIPQSSDHLVEIGPGQGALTRYLLEFSHLDLIEIDRDLVLHLQKQFKQPNITIHTADVLKFDFHQLYQQKKQLRILGNLPYNISTPLLFKLFSCAGIIADMHFLLQKEVVERICAAVNSKNYGRLSVMAQYYCQCDNLFTVDPQAFTPPPKVYSAYIRLIPQQNYQASNLDTLTNIVRSAFCYRRKTITNGLKPYLNSDQLQAIDIDPKCRPQQLSVEQFVRISNFVDSLKLD